MLYVEPNDTVAPIVAFIEAAQTQLLINNYFLDDAHVLQAISDDVRRGVKVYVVIAGNPLGLEGRVNEEGAALQQAGAVVKIAPPQFESSGRYSNFDHAKYAVSMNEGLVGTANWSTSAFYKNREYIYTSSDPALLQALTTIFMADFNNTQAPDVSSIDPDLVVSPGSENQLAAAIQQPGAVGIETEELGTDRTILSALEAKGADAYVVIPRTGVKPQILQELQAAGVKIRIIDAPYMHAKMVVGQQFAFIGSENFTITSLNYNREIGTFLHEPKDLQMLSSVFQQDWSNAH
jgi:cardiolipin synthase